jgi:flagellar biosynthesis protein FlhB
MAEEKQFEATQSRLEKARREGDVARSQDLCALCAFAAGTLAVAVIAAPLGGALRAIVVVASRGERWYAAAVQLGILVLVPIAASAAASVACAALQGGLTLNWPVPKVERLSPAENIKRILSRETAFAAVRSLIAFLCAGAAVVPAARSVASAALHGAGPNGLADAAWHGSLNAAAIACAAAGIFSSGDYMAQVRRRRMRLRMSHDELQRDRKEQDGDPLARSRRRSLHRQLSRGSLRRIKDAAFVVCNPQHVAVALEYRPPAVAVPRVLVRAADEAAARVRQAAREFGVPLIENIALARALYETRVEEYIPLECYVAVAEIVANLQAAGELK